MSSNKSKSDWYFINVSEKHEIEYLQEKYDGLYDYDEIVNLVNEAKVYFNKNSQQNITHKQFYTFMCEEKKHCIDEV